MPESPAKMYVLATLSKLLTVIATLRHFEARRMKKITLSGDFYMILPALV